jgi:tetratricopeptide (TPR) repeat protein
MPARSTRKNKRSKVSQTDGPAGPPSWNRPVWAVMPLLLPFFLFCFTVCPTIYWGDSTELALVARSAGIAHPTGYPLWSMAAAVFARLPLPGWEPALAANLLSALFGAAGCLALYALQRTLGAGRPLALFGSLALATVREMWLQCSIAEVYSLHVLLLTVVLLAAVRFHKEPCPRRLWAVLLFWGLALCNHMTSMLLLVPLGLLLLGGIRRITRLQAWQGPRRAVILVQSAGFLALGLLPYLYLPLRSLADPWPDYGNPETWEGLRWLVAGSQFRYLMFSSGAGYATGELKAVISQLPQQFSFWLLLLALPGFAWQWVDARQRVYAASFTLYAALVTAHAVNYRIDDKEAYFLPVYVMLALWIGFGGQLLATLSQLFVSKRTGTGWATWLRPVAVSLILSLLLLQQAMTAYPAVDRRDDRSLELYTGAVIQSTEPGALVIVGDFNVYSAYLYGSLVRGEYRQYDCLLDYLFPFPWYLEQLHRISPDVVVPREALEAARLDWEQAGGKVHGLDHGRQKEQVLKEVKRLIIEANLPRRPVYLHMRDDTTMKETWAGTYPLEYRGLSYRMATAGRPAVLRPYPADYPFFDRMPGRRNRAPHRYQLAANHKFSDAANRLGVILASSGQVSEALGAFDQALRHDPENYGVFRNRALLRMELIGDPAGARKDFTAYLAGWRASGEEPNREIVAIEEFLRRQASAGRDAGH